MKIITIVAASMLLVPLAVQAQSWNPSADDLVKLLQPKAGGATRGIRALSSPGTIQATATLPVAVQTPAPRNVNASTRPAPTTAHPTPSSTTETEGVNLTVQFESGSDRLTPSAMRMLDELGRALSNPSLASYKFRIVGHTDSAGSRDVNQVLSERRANAVSAYITSRYSVQQARLVAVGMGQSEPLVATPDGVAEPRNRRVQVINIGS